MTRCEGRIYRKTNARTSNATMKTWWNILICMWIYFIHGAVNVNVNLHSMKSISSVTQALNVSSQPSSELIGGNAMSLYEEERWKLRLSLRDYVGDFLLTGSPLTPTDGKLFTLICSFRDESAANIGWWQNNKATVVTQTTPACVKQTLAYGSDIINRTNVSCNSTAHSMAFRFNSTADQGSVWQCGGIVSDTAIYPKSNIYTIGTSSSAMSTRSLSTTTRTMETVSDPQTVTTQNGTAGHGHTSTLSLSTTTRTMETVSDPKTVTTQNGTDGHGHTSSPVVSTQSFSTTTRNMEISSDQETVTTKDAFTAEKDQNLLYIVVGAVGGAVLLIVVVVGVVCIRRRSKAAHQQNGMKEERNNITTPVNENTTGCDTVENDLYEGSRDVQPMNAAENQEDDFMLSDAYASVDMPVTNTCTPREEVPSGDVNLENLYAKPDKSKHTEVQHVSDIYAAVQKPKKKKQDDPMVSEDFNTGDVYAKPNKGLKAQK